MIEQLLAHEVLDIYNKKDSDYIFIDVREPQEWAEGTIPNIKKISLGDIENHLDELDKSKKYIMVCRVGGRSNKACSIMEEHGFKDVSNFQGGMLAWNDSDFPTEITE